MAIVRSLAIGQARKSAGNLTYQTVKGRTLAREKPLYVHNPKTPAQEAQRAKIRNLVEAWSGWFQLLAPYFTKIDGYGTAYNQFIKMNMSLASESWVNPANDQFWLRMNTYVSSGKYSPAALSFGIVNEQQTVSIADLSLRRLVDVNDRLVGVTSSETPGGQPGTPVITEKYLTQSDVDILRTGGEVIFHFPRFEYSSIFFYSSAKRISNTARADQ